MPTPLAGTREGHQGTRDGDRDGKGLAGCGGGCGEGTQPSLAARTPFAGDAGRETGTFLHINPKLDSKIQLHAKLKGERS